MKKLLIALMLFSGCVRETEYVEVEKKLSLRYWVYERNMYLTEHDSLFYYDVNGHGVNDGEDVSAVPVVYLYAGDAFRTRVPTLKFKGFCTDSLLPPYYLEAKDTLKTLRKGRSFQFAVRCVFKWDLVTPYYREFGWEYNGVEKKSGIIVKIPSEGVRHDAKQ